MNIGSNLRVIREKKKIGVNALARISKVNSGYISAIERGEKNNPTMDIINKLASALNVNAEELLKEHKEISQKSFSYENLKTVEDVMKFALNQPVIEDHNQLSIGDLSEDEINQFTKDVIEQMKLVSYKYRNKLK